MLKMLNVRDIFKRKFLEYVTYDRIHHQLTYKVDKSRVPVLDEKDLSEKFIKGSGPGGSRLNTSSNCVFLRHNPTGILVKCQEDRSRERNRKIAREILIKKLDNYYNGELSVDNQIKQIQHKKSLERKRKRQKILELKLKFAAQTSEEENK